MHYLPYSESVETIPVDEPGNIERVAAAVESILVRCQAKTGEFRADVHVKTHGYRMRNRVKYLISAHSGPRWRKPRQRPW
jgi:hypothetical protein